MCGIVGYIGPRDATPIILNGLKRLEYRGYDSAGLAILENDQIEVRRQPRIMSQKMKQGNAVLASAREIWQIAFYPVIQAQDATFGQQHD